jgi:hypothetical protein
MLTRSFLLAQAEQHSDVQSRCLMGISLHGGKTYCKSVLEAVAAKIEQDLALLKEFMAAASTN